MNVAQFIHSPVHRNLSCFYFGLMSNAVTNIFVQVFISLGSIPRTLLDYRVVCAQLSTNFLKYFQSDYGTLCFKKCDRPSTSYSLQHFKFSRLKRFLTVILILTKLVTSETE